MNSVAKFEKISPEQFQEEMKDPVIYIDDTDLAYEQIIMPKRATAGSAGYDFFAYHDIILEPHRALNIATGIRCKIDDGYVLCILPRSGQGFKYGVRLMNTVGVIDSDYYNAKNEGHIHVKLFNPSEETITIRKGDAFCQGIFLPYFLAEGDESKEERTGGFGSTSMNNG